MAKQSGMDMAITILLIVLGILVLVGELSVGPLLDVLGVVLIVIGALGLLGKMAMNQSTSIVLIVLGLVLFLNILGLGGAVTLVVNILVGAVLLVIGIKRLM